MPKKRQVISGRKTRVPSRRVGLAGRVTPTIEYCQTCTHPKHQHKFAKPGDTYTAAKMYSWGPAETIAITNFDGYCGNPLCTCTKFVAGGTKDEYENHIRYLGELAERIQRVELPTLRQDDTLRRHATKAMRKKKGTSGEPMQSLF